MTGRSSPPREPPRKVLTADDMRNGIERLKKRIEELTEFAPQKITESHPAQLKALSTSIQTTLARIFGEGTADYRRLELAANLQWLPPVMLARSSPVPLANYVQGYDANRKRSLALLQQAVQTLEEDLAEVEFEFIPNGVVLQAAAPIGREAFIVHGHAGELREAVARFLERIGLKPIILHEQANQGKTVIEKFEAHASVGFAIILLTPDDLGGAVGGGAQQPRARQNVILELGYFIGRLTRARVCALKAGDLELPSDILGIVWTPFDAGGGWKQALAKELEAAGYHIDWNTVMRS